MKDRRLETIRQIISSRVVHNQEELQTLLLENGINATQATLSRDLRELGIIKAHMSGGGYCYSLPSQQKALSDIASHRRFTIETIKSVEFSDNQAIIKTYPGFAGAVASVIDSNVHSGIMGTLAGDDVVLLILRKSAVCEEVVSEINLYIDGFKSKLINNK